MPSTQILATVHSLQGIGLALLVAVSPLHLAHPARKVQRPATVTATIRTVVERLSSKAPPYASVLDVPQLVWAAQPKIKDRVNAAIVTWVEGQVRTFAAGVTKDLAAARGLPASLPESSLHLTYKVERLDGGVLSVRLTVESYVRGQASPSQVPAGLTFNLRGGSAYTLSDLFAPHRAYLAALARVVQAGLRNFHPAGARCYVGGGPPAESASFAAWWLKGRSLVVAYPAGQYTAAYCGPPAIAIPGTALAGLLAPKGPLAPPGAVAP